MWKILTMTLRCHRKSWGIWAALVLLLSIEALAEFAGYHDNPEINRLIDALPPAVAAAFNMKAFNLTTLVGYYGVMFIYLAVMTALAAALWGSGMLAAEERERTADFLLALPVSRGVVYAAKALAAWLYTAALVLWIWGVTWAVTLRYHPTADFYRFIRLQMVALLLLGTLFWALGLLAAVGLRRRATVVLVVAVLGTYFLKVAIGLYDKLERLRWLTPFAYFRAPDFYRAGRLEGHAIALTLALSVLALVGGAVLYRRRDVG